MDIITGLVWITIIYCVLFFFDTFFKSCAHYPYIKFLHETGFKIKFFHLQWNTTSLNRIFVRWGNSNIRFFNIWFSVGLYATLVLLPISVCLILYAIFQLLCNKSYEEQNIIVEPIIPAGHALAAVKEDVHLVNVGITLLFVIPVAYVNINFEKLSSLNPWKTLRILCAGVWHNLVLSFIGFLLYMIMSNVFATMFYVNNGIYITEVNPNSLLAGSRGLQIGNIVTNINDCVVRDEITWNNCLLNTWYNKPGFCVTTDLVHSVDESIPILELPNGGYDCCGPTKPDWLCFEYADNNDGILELPPHMCLPARKVVETCTSFCDLNSRICPTNYHCIYPLLPNSTTLLKIKVIQKPDVIYIGHPLDVLHATHVSPYIPRHFFNTPKLPDMVMKLLRYVISFSLGLALVNVIPCIYMDGHHIVNLLTQIVFKERLKSRSAITLISVIISLIGTALLIFLCIYSIWSRMLK
ncbi:hypothetical protein PPYR_15504 [Photinus pyralis]|uniref:Membrane-bound transcription factor site-2 protease n=1 Tax=Photinus pyralis TaxID=7054 RepID=A0A5N3ZYN5_PHOPY|nr:hypothetical protein PPYR_15504 [Photinus pyralis]